MRKIKYIVTLAIMTISLCSCGKIKDLTSTEGIVFDHSTQATTQAKDQTTETVDPIIDDGICDGYTAPTVVTDEFLEAYNLCEGDWVTTDGNAMMKIYQEGDLYYIWIQGTNENGDKANIPDYNMFEIKFSDDDYHSEGAREGEKYVAFDCNDGLMQYRDSFYAQENGEYLRYLSGSDFIFYPYEREDIPVESYIFINKNIIAMEEEGLDYGENIAVLQENAEILAKLNYNLELSLSYEDEDNNQITYITRWGYGKGNLTISFSKIDGHILSVVSDEGEVLYETDVVIECQ